MNKEILEKIEIIKKHIKEDKNKIKEVEDKILKLEENKEDYDIIRYTLKELTIHQKYLIYWQDMLLKVYEEYKQKGGD